MGFTVKRRIQGAKHRAFVAYKPYRFKVAHATEPLVRATHKLLPPTLDSAAWPATELGFDAPLIRETTEAVPRRIFTFWTGRNELTPNRRAGLKSLATLNPDIPVELITPENLSDLLVAGEPMHPAYDHLSLIHRSDYLSCYALHFHGGGYADLKRATHSWAPVFDRMDDTDAWMAGYRVPVRLMTPNMPDPSLERLMRRFSEQRLGQTAYIARPGTPLTAEWWRWLHIHLDRRMDDLRRNPGNERGDNAGYPLHLNEILAQIIDPLQVKYRTHLLYDQRLFMEHEDYI